MDSSDCQIVLRVNSQPDFKPDTQVLLRFLRDSLAKTQTHLEGLTKEGEATEVEGGRYEWSMLERIENTPPNNGQKLISKKELKKTTNIAKKRVSVALEERRTAGRRQRAQRAVQREFSVFVQKNEGNVLQEYGGKRSLRQQFQPDSRFVSRNGEIKIPELNFISILPEFEMKREEILSKKECLLSRMVQDWQSKPIEFKQNRELKKLARRI